VGAFIDLTGNRYGRWMVLERTGNDKRGRARWLCRCDCGNEKIVAGASLRSGASRSCGCLQKERASRAGFVDLTGHRYGRLTVVKRMASNKHGQTTWLCKCNCGNEVIVLSNNLRSGNTKSCGCLNKERVREAHLLPEGVAAFNELFTRMQRNAEERNLEWQLTREQVRYLTKQSCYYCGAEPSKVSHRPQFNGTYVYNGIDRVDNAKGYTVDNVVPCCEHCNYAKRTRSVEQFRDWVIKVYEHFAVGEVFTTKG